MAKVEYLYPTTTTTTTATTTTTTATTTTTTTTILSHVKSCSSEPNINQVEAFSNSLADIIVAKIVAVGLCQQLSSVLNYR